MLPPSCRAVPGATAASTEAATGNVSSRGVASHARIAELEAELAHMHEQLQEAEAHLMHAEAGIRDEVVCEIQVRAQATRARRFHAFNNT